MTHEGTFNHSPARLLPYVGIPVFLALANQTMLSVALPSIGENLGELRRLPWLVVGYAMALTIAGPVYGLLGDTHGRDFMLKVALCVFLVGNVLCGLAPSMETLTAGRVLQGLGGGGMMSLSQALIGQLVSPRDRGRAQGYVATVSVTAAAVGPVFGGLLVEAVGWRGMFLATTPLALLAMAILATRKIPAGKVGARQFDLRGFFFLVAFVILCTSFLESLKLPDFHPYSPALAVAAAASLAGLVVSQRHGMDRLFARRLLAMADVSRSCIMVACHGAALVSLVTVVPIFLSILRGDPAIEIAVTMLALTISFGTAGIVSGNLITLTGHTASIPTVSLPLGIIGLVLLAMLGHGMTRIELMVLYFVIGLFCGPVMGVAHTTVQFVAPSDIRGRAAGSITFFRAMGAMIGTSIVTLVLFSLAPRGGFGHLEIVCARRCT